MEYSTFANDNAKTYPRRWYFQFLQKEETVSLNSEVHHLPRVGPKQLCALTPLGFTILTLLTLTFYFALEPWGCVKSNTPLKDQCRLSFFIAKSTECISKWKNNH